MITSRELKKSDLRSESGSVRAGRKYREMW